MCNKAKPLDIKVGKGGSATQAATATSGKPKEKRKWVKYNIDSIIKSIQLILFNPYLICRILKAVESFYCSLGQSEPLSNE